MGALSKILSKKQLSKEFRVCILGSASAGKTTLVRYLETGKQQLESPSVTLGLDYREKAFKIAGLEFKLIDVGGQQVYQDVFWDVAVQQSDAVVYVIDSTIRPETDQERFKLIEEQFYYTNEVINENSVLLILLNKQDLVDENPMTPKDFASYFKVRRIKTKRTAFLTGSAKYGNGIDDAFTWFAEELMK